MRNLAATFLALALLAYPVEARKRKPRARPTPRCIIVKERCPAPPVCKWKCPDLIKVVGQTEQEAEDARNAALWHAGNDGDDEFKAVFASWIKANPEYASQRALVLSWYRRGRADATKAVMKR